jgi:hypothetical protein
VSDDRGIHKILDPTGVAIIDITVAGNPIYSSATFSPGMYYFKS